MQDPKKEGGKYITVTGNVIKIDEYKKKMILENNSEKVWIIRIILCIFAVLFRE